MPHTILILPLCKCFTVHFSQIHVDYIITHLLGFAYSMDHFTFTSSYSARLERQDTRWGTFITLKKNICNFHCLLLVDRILKQKYSFFVKCSLKSRSTYYISFGAFSCILWPNQRQLSWRGVVFTNEYLINKYTK